MAMADTRPGIEERHLAASNTSDMTVQADRRRQSDVILAAGMVARGSQLGHALIHLGSEWDRCDKPARRSEAEIARRAEEIPDKKGRPDIRRATVEAMVWHAAAMRHRAATLTGRNLVMGLMEEWAHLHNVDPDLLSPAIFHWLSPACPACNRTGKIHSAYALPGASAKTCNHCAGTGEWPKPLGADRVKNYIKSCIGKAKGDMAGKLYG